MLTNKKYYQFRHAAATTVIFSAVLLLLAIVPISFAQAQVDIGLNAANNIGLPSAPTTDVRQLIVDIVRYLLSFLGIVAVVVIIYAGWLWTTSRGNPQQIERAKKVLTNAVIGLLIIVLSFAIVSWIANWILGTISGTGGGGNGNGSSGVGLAASGNSAIESTYPARDQLDVPRNTKIVITFREPIKTTDIITNDGHVNTANIKIYRSSADDTQIYSPNLLATTTDGRTFRFMQVQPYMGSPTEKVWYTVKLIGSSSGIHKASGDVLFAIGGYSWQFELSTMIDNTPPKIASIIPMFGSTYARNIVVQINFNKAIDPISASGPTSSFNNIRVNSGTVAGNFYISNEYQTVEFLTNDQCGINSCGNPIYCLPAASNISVLALAATLASPGSGSSQATLNNDGIVDMASNSLDGNSDNVAEGPTTQNSLPVFNPALAPMATSSDDYTWQFATNNNIDLTVPVISAVNPGYAAHDINAAAIPYADFSKLLMSSSLIKDNVALTPNSGQNDVFYWLTSANQPSGTPTWTRAFINHRNFVMGSNVSYTPAFNSGVKDIYQNCFYPSAGSATNGGPVCTETSPATLPACCNGSQQVHCP